MSSRSMTLASWSSTIRMAAFRISAASSMAVPGGCIVISLLALSSRLRGAAFGGVQQGDVERIHEFMHTDRLGQVTEETSFHSFFNVTWHGIRRQRQDRDMGRGG